MALFGRLSRFGATGKVRLNAANGQRPIVEIYHIALRILTGESTALDLTHTCLCGR